jgi:hypothetical protein
MSARRTWQQHLAAAAALAGFVAALYARLLFTNRALAEGDILYYFYPYRDYAAAALREGRLPLWNPYIFLGAPFLANPQAAVLYPLHWPLSWLPAPVQIAWSAALHTWIVGLGGYALLRGWGKSAWAGLAAGLVLAGSGFFGGLIGHINQMNAAAWLPWALWVLVRADGAADWRGRAQGREPSGCAAAGQFALLTTLMLLAGHTQTAYINLAGLWLWCMWPLIPALLRRTWAAPRPQAGSRLWARQVARRLAIYGVGVAVGGLTAAPQLLPTLELSSRGLRQGGLSYAEASSFSLKPLQLLWSLLPSYGLADLSAVFGTSGYTEYVTYVGLIGPALAIWAARRGAWRRLGPAVATGLLLAVIGLFLALGRWNPVYYLLYLVVPGFDLFRAPARWMMLYTLGMAILAGAGLDALRRGWASWALPVLICALIAGELLIAATSLPHTQPTAPQAVTDLRTAPAHLLTDPDRRLHPAAGGRFMSMSVVTFDPGDMPDYRRIMLESDPPQLDARAFARLIIALKVQEIIAPNLALLWRIPSLDGFDGGVLPLRRYLDLLTLFAPAGELIPDGRLRERVREIPPTDLLALYNVRYIITDKTADLWFRDIYYDRQIGAHLGRDRPIVAVAAERAFSATQVNLIATLEAAGDAPLSDGAINGAIIGQVTVRDDAGEQRFDLLAGSQIAAAALDSPSAGATVAFRDVDAGRQEYLVELPLAGPTRVHTVTVTWQPTAPELPPLTVQAVTLVDGRTGMFSPLLPSDRGRYRRVHSGDVKVYENLDVLPRAYLVQRTLPAADPDQAIALVAERNFDPATTAVVEAPLTLGGTPAPGDAATLVAYAPERVVVATTSAAPALLILSDTHDPGWHATVDGVPAAILRTNGHVRGVAIPAGRHTVEFVYAPPSWPRGLAVGAVGALLLILLLAGPRLLSLRRSARDSV